MLMQQKTQIPSYSSLPASCVIACVSFVACHNAKAVALVSKTIFPNCYVRSWFLEGTCTHTGHLLQAN